MHKAVLGLCFFALVMAALLATTPAGAQSGGTVSDAVATLAVVEAHATAAALNAGQAAANADAAAARAAAQAAAAKAEAARQAADVAAQAAALQAARATVDAAAVQATLDAAATTTALEVQATQAALDWQNAQVQALQTRTAADAIATDVARQADATATVQAYAEARQADATRQAVVLAALDAETAEATKRQEFITWAVVALVGLAVVVLAALLLRYAWLTWRAGTPAPSTTARPAPSVVDLTPITAERMPPIRVYQSDHPAAGAMLQAAWDMAIKPAPAESEV